MDAQLIASLIGIVLGGANLAFLLKVLYNDLHELRALLIQHLRDHTKLE